MKKIVLLIMVVCCALVTQAENTDISTIENVVYIEPVIITAGTQYTISVKMKNAVEAEGFGFDLYLPECITVAIDGDGFPLVELSTVRTTPKKTNSFDAAFQSDGCLRVLAASTNASTISGSDGEVCLITVLIASNVNEGDYPIYLRNIAISDTQAQSHRTEQVESTITVTAPAEMRTILDETSTTGPIAESNVNVRVKRTIKAGEWSTICLPFAMTETQVINAFGSDVQLADFNDYVYNDAEGKICVKFIPATAIEANHPYIIKVSQPVSQFTVDGVDIDPQEAIVDFDTSRRKNQPRQFVGTYVANTILDWGTLFLSGNKFWYSIGETKMKAFRAYFNFIDLIPDFEDNYDARIVMSFDEETTGVNDRMTMPDDKYYNLNGQRVKPASKGLYIRNGKKVVIK